MLVQIANDPAFQAEVRVDGVFHMKLSAEGILAFVDATPVRQVKYVRHATIIALHLTCGLNRRVLTHAGKSTFVAVYACHAVLH